MLDKKAHSPCSDSFKVFYQVKLRTLCMPVKIFHTKLTHQVKPLAMLLGGKHDHLNLLKARRETETASLV